MTVPRQREGESSHRGLLVFTPLRFEARAVRKGLPADVRVMRSGLGKARAERAAQDSQQVPFKQLMIMGTAVGVAQDLRPGDVVVDASFGAAPLLVGELRRAGLRARSGKLATVDHLVNSASRERLAAEGILAADMESAVLAGAAGGRPAAVIRAVSDRGFGPGMVTGGLAALRSLRAAAPIAVRWADACVDRTVLLAGPRSFCAGVERAIEIVQRALEITGSPVYVRKQIVHNKRVVSDLEGQGAVFVDELEEVPDGATVVFSAHGVSPAVRADAEKRGLSVIDATCPLVAKVHTEARRFAREGYTVALIGHDGHEEVEGTLGEAPESTVLVQTPEDVAGIEPGPRGVAYLMQTTLALEEATTVADALRERFPDVKTPGSDDICYATTNRQAAIREVAAEADLVLVAGSKNSSNSVRLVETVRRAGKPAYLVDDASEIELSWLTGVTSIGLTAGASAPPEVVSEIITTLSGLGQVSVQEHVVTTESVQFGLPREVRRLCLCQLALACAWGHTS